MRAAADHTEAAAPTLAGGLFVGGSSDTFERCVPEETGEVSSADLEGSYRGSGDGDGATITLKATSGQFGGTMTVHPWPSSDFPRYGKDKSFDGSGTWQVDKTAEIAKYATVRVSFDEPDALTSADPDTCPAFRLESG
ncbi:hypothetical protein [Streptomyces sp. NPDC056982]|uniref:hypothetical protein n=1 Tax=Streptomyces sp. NPDC056982 TaxID=3345986 RepID=UPI0036347057